MNMGIKFPVFQIFCIFRLNGVESNVKYLDLNLESFYFRDSQNFVKIRTSQKFPTLQYFFYQFI